MGFDDWYLDPERGPEIERALERARQMAEGKVSNDLFYLFAEQLMRRAWNAACVECMSINDRRDPAQYNLH